MLIEWVEQTFVQVEGSSTSERVMSPSSIILLRKNERVCLSPGWGIFRQKIKALKNELKLLLMCFPKSKLHERRLSNK